MKQGISTWVHHLVDALANKRVLLANTDPGEKRRIIEGVMRLAPVISRLPLFVVQTDGRDLHNPVLIRHARDTWTGLPFPEMLLEVTVSGMIDEHTGEYDLTDRWVILAAEQDGIVHITLYTTDRDPTDWCIGYGRAELDPLHPLKEFNHFPPKHLPGEFDQDTTDIMTDAVGMVMAFIGLLNTPAIETEVHEAPAKLNKARAKRQRAAIPTYTAVTLRLPKRKPGEREGSEHHGRASPRTHWRAGHKREYQPGKYATIPPTLVAYSGEGEPPAPKYNVIVDIPGRTPS